MSNMCGQLTKAPAYALLIFVQFPSIWQFAYAGDKQLPLLTLSKELECAATADEAGLLLDSFQAINLPNRALPNESFGTDSPPSLHAASLDIALFSLTSTSKRFPELAMDIEQVVLQWDYCDVVLDGAYYDLITVGDALETRLAYESSPINWNGFHSIGFLGEHRDRFEFDTFKHDDAPYVFYELDYSTLFRGQCLPHPQTSESFYDPGTYFPQRLVQDRYKKSSSFPSNWSPGCATNKSIDQPKQAINFPPERQALSVPLVATTASEDKVSLRIEKDTNAAAPPVTLAQKDASENRSPESMRPEEAGNNSEDTNVSADTKDESVAMELVQIGSSKNLSAEITLPDMASDGGEDSDVSANAKEKAVIIDVAQNDGPENHAQESVLPSVASDGEKVTSASANAKEKAVSIDVAQNGTSENHAPKSALPGVASDVEKVTSATAKAKDEAVTTGIAQNSASENHAQESALQSVASDEEKVTGVSAKAKDESVATDVAQNAASKNLSAEIVLPDVAGDGEEDRGVSAITKEKAVAINDAQNGASEIHPPESVLPGVASNGEKVTSVSAKANDVALPIEIAPVDTAKNHLPESTYPIAESSSEIVKSISADAGNTELLEKNGKIDAPENDSPVPSIAAAESIVEDSKAIQADTPKVLTPFSAEQTDVTEIYLSDSFFPSLESKSRENSITTTVAKPKVALAEVAQFELSEGNANTMRPEISGDGISDYIFNGISVLNPLQVPIEYGVVYPGAISVHRPLDVSPATESAPVSLTPAAVQNARASATKSGVAGKHKERQTSTKSSVKPMSQPTIASALKDDDQDKTEFSEQLTGQDSVPVIVEEGGPTPVIVIESDSPTTRASEKKTPKKAKQKKKYYGFSGSVTVSNKSFRADGFSVTSGISYKPIKDSYWFARTSTNFRFNDDQFRYTWGIGYDDWHPGTLAVQLNHWGPLFPGDGLDLENAIAAATYKFKKSEFMKEKNVSSSVTLSKKLSGDPVLAWSNSWSPSGKWFVRSTLNFPLKSAAASWSYGFGYANYAPFSFSLEYNNWGYNKVFDDNFNGNGLLSFTYRWRY